MEELKKCISALQKKLNRVTKLATKFNNVNTIRKQQLSRTNVFLKKLLDENRITKDELKDVYPRKSNK